mmetsp:Transcript_26676/g.74708  ORF Transcript_26676/g.74708 Transcript_26676/m.74708 type:complete len:510 (+) Transcript_26676:341-1870(+)
MLSYDDADVYLLLRLVIVIHLIGLIKYFLFCQIDRTRFPWGFDLLFSELLDVAITEPSMVQDILLSEGAQSLIRILFEQPIDQIKGFLGRLLLDGVVRVVANAFEERHLIHAFIKEWVFTLDEFVNEDSQTPVVRADSVPSVGHDFRWQVVGRSAEGERLVRHALGETKVRQHWIPVLVDEDVLRLQISEDVLSAVHEGQGICHDDRVKSTLLFSDPGHPIVIFVLVVDDVEEFAAWRQTQEHGYRLAFLVHVHNLDDERIRKVTHHLDFGSNIGNGIGPVRIARLLDLERVRHWIRGVLVGNQPDLPEQSFAEDAVLRKVLLLDFFIFLLFVDLRKLVAHHCPEFLQRQQSAHSLLHGNGRALGLDLLRQRRQRILGPSQQKFVSKVPASGDDIFLSVAGRDLDASAPHHVQAWACFCVSVEQVAVLAVLDLGHLSHQCVELDVGWFFGLDRLHLRQGLLVHRLDGKASDIAENLLERFSVDGQRFSVGQCDDVGHGRFLLGKRVGSK